jgi:hypothetical protein
MLRRRNWNVTNGYTCVLCHAHQIEDWIHLFFDCNFSRRIWSYLQVEWSQGDTIEEMFFKARKEFAKSFFFEVVILACWHIWKQRNNKVFEHIRPLHVHGVKDKHSDSFKLWFDSLL